MLYIKKKEITLNNYVYFMLTIGVATVETNVIVRKRIYNECRMYDEIG